MVPGYRENIRIGVNHLADSRRKKTGDAHNRGCWHELLRGGVLNLEPADLEEHMSVLSIIRASPLLTESWKSKVKVPGDNH